MNSDPRPAWSEALGLKAVSVMPPSLEVLAWTNYTIFDQFGNGFRIVIRRRGHTRTVTIAFIVDPTRYKVQIGLVAKREAKKILYAPHRKVR